MRLQTCFLAAHRATHNILLLPHYESHLKLTISIEASRALLWWLGCSWHLLHGCCWCSTSGPFAHCWYFGQLRLRGLLPRTPRMPAIHRGEGGQEAPLGLHPACVTVKPMSLWCIFLVYSLIYQPHHSRADFFRDCSWPALSALGGEAAQ